MRLRAARGRLCELPGCIRATRGRRGRGSGTPGRLPGARPGGWRRRCRARRRRTRVNRAPGAARRRETRETPGPRRRPRRRAATIRRPAVSARGRTPAGRRSPRRGRGRGTPATASRAGPAPSTERRCGQGRARPPNNVRASGLRRYARVRGAPGRGACGGRPCAPPGRASSPDGRRPNRASASRSAPSPAGAGWVAVFDDPPFVQNHYARKKARLTDIVRDADERGVLPELAGASQQGLEAQAFEIGIARQVGGDTHGALEERFGIGVAAEIEVDAAVGIEDVGDVGMIRARFALENTQRPGTQCAGFLKLALRAGGEGAVVKPAGGSDRVADGRTLSGAGLAPGVGCHVQGGTVPAHLRSAADAGLHYTSRAAASRNWLARQAGFSDDGLVVVGGEAAGLDVGPDGEALLGLADDGLVVVPRYAACLDVGPDGEALLGLADDGLVVVPRYAACFYVRFEFHVLHPLCVCYMQFLNQVRPAAKSWKTHRCPAAG